MPGFGLRITSTGARAFVLNYRVDGRERRLTIGTWPTWNATAARERAKELRREIDQGHDPLGYRQQRRADPTFGELVEIYLRVKASSQKGAAQYEGLLRRDALPAWKHVRTVDIRRSDVIALVEEKAKTAPIAANRLLELLRRVFNFAIVREIVAANPCSQVPKPGKERAKDRVLSREEICQLWEALDGPSFTASTAAAIRLLLLTAQRPGEIVTAEWAEIDLDEGWWTIPAEKAKNGLAHRVPLNKTSRDILQRLPQASRWVFPSPREGQHVHRNALALALRRSRSRPNQLPVPDNFTLHDLRRTAASKMAAKGVQQFVIGRVLNHAQGDVTATYARYGYDREKRAALDLWDRELRSILNGKSPKVVEIRR